MLLTAKPQRYKNIYPEIAHIKKGSGSYIIRAFFVLLPCMVILVSCAEILPFNTVEKVDFQVLEPNPDALLQYPFLNNIEEFFQKRENGDPVTVSIAKIEGYPLIHPLLLVSIAFRQSCGSGGCSLRYYQILEDGSYRFVPDYRVSRGSIYKLVCGSDLYLIEQGRPTMGYGIWKYMPEKEVLFMFMSNTRDFAEATECGNK